MPTDSKLLEGALRILAGAPSGSADPEVHQALLTAADALEANARDLAVLEKAIIDFGKLRAEDAREIERLEKEVQSIIDRECETVEVGFALQARASALEAERDDLRRVIQVLRKAGTTVMDGLNARIHAAPKTAVPVFAGIAELYGALILAGALTPAASGADKGGEDGNG